MIGLLTGKIRVVDQDRVIVSTSGGVGYLVNVVENNFLEDQEIELFIYTSVSENAISLWGFASEPELRLFEKLLTVSGVGMKTAQNLIKHVGPLGLVRSISLGDIGGLKAPGVGQKTAERLVLELKDKLAGLAEKLGSDISSEMQNLRTQDSRVVDAAEAVEHLGYARKDIDNALRNIAIGEDDTSQKIVKRLLASL
jgi:Holliday junction DNA helicase RuvA